MPQMKPPDSVGGFFAIRSLKIDQKYLYKFITITMLRLYLKAFLQILPECSKVSIP
jgi:hypothetical protein